MLGKEKVNGLIGVGAGEMVWMRWVKERQQLKDVRWARKGPAKAKGVIDAVNLVTSLAIAPKVQAKEKARKPEERGRKHPDSGTGLTGHSRIR